MKTGLKLKAEMKKNTSEINLGKGGADIVKKKASIEKKHNRGDTNNIPRKRTSWREEKKE